MYYSDFGIHSLNLCRNPSDDSVAKMAAAAEALEKKEKVLMTTSTNYVVSAFNVFFFVHIC